MSQANSLGGLLTAGKGVGLVKDALLGAAYGAGSADGDLQDRAIGAGAGGVLGGVLGKVIPGVAKMGGKVIQNAMQHGATSAAIKDAPGAAELSSVASQMFKSSKSAGVGVKPQVYGTMAADLARQAHAADIDHELDGAAWTVYDRMVKLARDGFQDPSALSFGRLHNLRQLAQDVVMEKGAKDRTKRFAQNIIDGLDNMVGGLKPSDLTLPANRLGGGAASDAGNALLNGISTWSRAKKVSLVEEAIYKAGNQASGLENGLRVHFRALLQNPKTRRLFTQAELQAIERVANGTAASNIARTLGKLGFDFGSGRNALGGGIGLILGNGIGGPLGAILTAAAGTGARKVSEKMAVSGAERVARTVATPNIPQIKLNNPLAQLPGAPFAFPVIDQTRQPLRITVRGGS
jgi:hypothetical protein